MNIKEKKIVLFSVILLLLMFNQIVIAAEKPIRVLIYSGANNHDWAKTTPVIKAALAKAAISADIIDKPGDVTDKLLSKYDVIVSNWNNINDKSQVWSKETRQAYLDFISKGGGHVVVHAGGSSFYDWPEYHKIVASWGKLTNHGAIHEFPVKVKLPNHPICQGVKPFQMRDELWRTTTFPTNSKVLMTAFSSKESGGSDTIEPVLALSKFGKGRCVNFMLGHDVKTMDNSDFKTVLIRSILWAGYVNLENINLQIKKYKAVPKQSK